MLGKNETRVHFLRTTLVLALLCILLRATPGDADSRFFGKSYAVVVGINEYRHSKWPKLSYAVPDAKGIGAFLRAQGFEVIELYEKSATKEAIVAAIEDNLVPKLTTHDRVFFFFAGHGVTRTVGEEERGYLVPYEGTDSYATLLSMNQVRDLSSVLSQAKHQLFILDACFGGLLGVSRSSTVDPRTPNYIEEITKRRARQVLTAGGANQRVVDGGADGHSLFTGQLLNALQGVGDRNGDGYITFTELASYMQVAASAYNQTPGISELSGHEQGDFVFVTLNRKPTSRTSASLRESQTGLSRSQDTDVYQLLKYGKHFFMQKNYTEARELFSQAAELGNAEAMVFLAKMDWEGWGGEPYPDKAIEWLRAAGEKGEFMAMRNLSAIYSQLEQYQNPTEAKRWRTAVEEIERERHVVMLFDPSGNVERNEVMVQSQNLIVPAAPTSLRIK